MSPRSSPRRFGRTHPRARRQQRHRRHRRRATSIWRCARSCSAPSARPASAARSTRRIIAHTSIVRTLTSRLLTAYTQVPIGDPLDAGTLMGPLVTAQAVDADGGRDRGRRWPKAAPCSAAASAVRISARSSSSRRSSACRRRSPIVQHETFAPILYLLEYRRFDEAIAMHNDVPQGLSSAIFTESMRHGRRVPLGARIGLRHRQRQHRHVGRGDRRRVRRRKGNRRRPRVRLRRLEGLHAPPDQHRQLVHAAAARAGNHVRIGQQKPLLIRLCK